MESGGSVDLRGAQVVPLALKVIRKTGPVDDPQLRHAIDVLAAWVSSGAYRRDADANGVYEQAEAIGIMDAWWPRLVSNEFRPTLGADLFGAIENVLPLDDPNRLHHLGSAWQDGWYGYSSKDLRSMLAKIKRLHKRGGGKHGGGHGKASAHGGHGKKHKSGVKGAYSRIYCGGGKPKACRAALLGSLQDALGVPTSELYPAVNGCTQGDAQWCNDAIFFRPVGLIDQPYTHWINRPTFQQVVELFSHR
jgi:hypothetical protein